MISPRCCLASRPVHASHAHNAALTPADIGPLPQWSLADLYKGMQDPRFAADLDRAADLAEAFAARYRSALGVIAAGPRAAAELFEAIAAFERLEDLLGRVGSYASLVYVEDTADPARTKFLADAQERITQISTDLLFFTLDLNALDEALIDAAAALPPLDHYRPWLTDIRKDRPYQLDTRLEQLLHEKAVTGRAAWTRLFDETMTALRFEVGGEALTLEPTLNLLQDARADLRETAAGALAETLRQNLRVFTLITNTLAKDLEISDRWRGFKDVAESRHLSNRVEPGTVAALVCAVQAAHPALSHRYYGLKARWMGQDKLNHWDRNAPLPQSPSATVPWREARATVLDAYAGFSPKLAGLARRFFDERWIDAGVRPGKAPGAFSHPTVPSAHPYVLMNYQGRPRDVMILAHELGHGVHQLLAAPQGALMAQTPLTLAETASVFGEMLTFRALAAKTESREARFALLALKVEDMLNTVVRQIAFYSFERRIHEARRQGEVTAERIGSIWLEVQAESLGPAIRLGPGYETFWAYVPHFIHSPFYVYAYAFGDCLVNSLYGVYQTAETGFAERYLALLEAGGSRPYSELLAPFGLDARDPQFWSIGLKVIEGLIDELEGLPQP
jgi:oligoendopeptidase F